MKTAKNGPMCMHASILRFSPKPKFLDRTLIILTAFDTNDTCTNTPGSFTCSATVEMDSLVQVRVILVPVNIFNRH